MVIFSLDFYCAEAGFPRIYFLTVKYLDLGSHCIANSSFYLNIVNEKLT